MQAHVQPPVLLALRQFQYAPWPERRELLHAWVYRFGIYAALNFIDEPAWLALVFC
jgi:hypothetical protein